MNDAINIVREYLTAYEQEKNELIIKDDESAIRELVVAYEKQVRESFAEEKAKNIANKNSEIAALTALILRMEADELKKQLQLNIEGTKNPEEELFEDVEVIETNDDNTNENVLGDLALSDL